MVPGMPKIEFQPADIGRGRGLRHALVERGGAGADDIAIDAGLAEPARRKPDHHARHAAVAHDQVGADADDIDRNFVRQMREEIGEIVFVRRREQHLRRTADAKPGQLASDWFASSRPRNSGIAALRSGVMSGKSCVTAPAHPSAFNSPSPAAR